jgi:SAM-dependent methyltransferase
LYDALHAFESRHRKGIAYPVHKKLRFRDRETSDIYDWIRARVDVPDHGSILDAGCGVGFGAIRLAENGTCRVVGVSLSEKEIGRARWAAAQLGLADRVEFRQASFDDMPRATYDLVVAVESLKHSSDLRRSLRSLLGSLKHPGTLVIVEDLYADHAGTTVAEKLMTDWGLTRLYTEADYLAILGPARCQVEDLTDNVQRPGRLAIRLRLACIELLLPFAAPRNATALRAFRGGLRLQTLYADGTMAYKAIFYRNAEATAR